MSEFSNMVNVYVHQKDIKVSAMVQYCGMDRSTMYKVLNGKRNPSSLGLVEKMADFLKLTPLERQKLIEAYRISVIGSNTYYRRMNILNLLKTYPEMESCGELAPSGRLVSLPSVDFFGSATDCPAEGKANIQRLLYQILLKESQRTDGVIQIAAQPSWNYLFELLQVMSYKNDSLEIRHMVCMNNNVNANYKYEDYNISYLHQLLPLVQSNSHYMPRYYYDNIDSHFRNLNMLPYWVITSEYAINCTSDIQHAIFYKNPETVAMAKNLFSQQYETTSVLFNKLSHKGTEYLFMMQKILGSGPAWSVSPWPCLALVFDRTLCERYVIRDLPQRPQLIETFVSYSRQMKELCQKHLIKTYFTPKGISYFMQTGRINDIFFNLCTEVSVSDRKKILDAFLKYAACGQACLLKGEAETLSLNIACFANKHTGMLRTADSDNKYSYLTFQDKNTFDSYLDFMSHLEDMNMAASQEETCEYLGGGLGEKY